MPRLCTMNINRSNKRKWFHMKKDKKQMISCRNYDRCRLCRWSSASQKYIYPSWISAAYPGEIGFYVNTNKTKFKCFKQGAISTFSSKPLKLVDQFTYFSRNISLTESDVSICIEIAWTVIVWLSIIWKSDLSD